MYRQMHSLSADNGHIGRYIVQSANDRMSADYLLSANYLQYRIGRISVSAEFPNLDIVCTLPPGVTTNKPPRNFRSRRPSPRDVIGEKIGESAVHKIIANEGIHKYVMGGVAGLNMGAQNDGRSITPLVLHLETILSKNICQK